MLDDPIRIASGVAVYTSNIVTVYTWCICGKARLRRGLIHRFDSNHNKATYYAVADSTRVLRQHSAKEQKERDLRQIIPDTERRLCLVRGNIITMVPYRTRVLSMLAAVLHSTTLLRILSRYSMW